MFFRHTVCRLLVMPVPNNNVRGAITKWVTGLWDIPGVRYTFMAILGLDLIYFYFVMDAILHPLYDLGLLTPIEQAPTCELKMGARSVRHSGCAETPTDGPGLRAPSSQISSATSATHTSRASRCSCFSYSCVWSTYRRSSTWCATLVSFAGLSISCRCMQRTCIALSGRDPCVWQARADIKAMGGGVPMGQPAGVPMGKPVKAD